MAKKLVDEIREAEANGERLIADAELRSKDISAQAENSAKKAADELIDRAELEVNGMLEAARAEAADMKTDALKQTQALCDALRLKSELNTEKAVRHVIELLKS